MRGAGLYCAIALLNILGCKTQPTTGTCIVDETCRIEVTERACMCDGKPANDCRMRRGASFYAEGKAAGAERCRRFDDAMRSDR